MDGSISSTYHFSSTSASVQFGNFYAFSTNILPPLNFPQSIFFIITALITFLQLSDKNPFETHPNTMGVAVCAWLVCYLACSGQLNFSVGRFSAASVAGHCMVWSGNASVASLASVFAPDSVRPLLYVVFVSVSAREFVHWLYKRIFDAGREFYYRIRWYFAWRFSRMALNSFFEPARILPS